MHQCKQNNDLMFFFKFLFPDVPLYEVKKKGYSTKFLELSRAGNSPFPLCVFCLTKISFRPHLHKDTDIDDCENQVQDSDYSDRAGENSNNVLC